MTIRDLDKDISCAKTLAPALVAATATGTGVDLAGFLTSAVIVHVGAITDGTHTLAIEESAASGSGYTAVAAGDLSGTVGALTANTVYEFGYLGSKRYIRAKVTVTGSPSTGGTYGAIVVRAGARTGPN